MKKLSLMVLLTLTLVSSCYACLPEPSKILHLRIVKCGDPVAGVTVLLDKIGGRGGLLYETEVTDVNGIVEFGDGKLGGWIIPGTYTFLFEVYGKNYSLTVTIDCSKTTWEYTFNVPYRRTFRWRSWRWLGV